MPSFLDSDYLRERRKINNSKAVVLHQHEHDMHDQSMYEPDQRRSAQPSKEESLLALRCLNNKQVDRMLMCLQETELEEWPDHQKARPQRVILRHRNAINCLKRWQCSHWKWPPGESQPKAAGRDKTVVDIEAICMDEKDTQRMFNWYEPDYTDGKYKMDDTPCLASNLLKPDWSVLRLAGLHPLMWQVVQDEDDVGEEAEKMWMDPYGRRIAMRY
ncbi:hypothetical protein F53441_5412 [Fusarium austroafricanum]|uniref:Uncharacterized protein n=1 Tax=Fusarium austroafricanum TaxID=2364996 RepID=A0A8H4KL67_9HYPO|nr:hypothetical protein F53441_5412 [Fusarium austroafricanum]